MGQRHQAFVIAKVCKGNQRRYRCVAAFHWQWLYGQGPARATTRFINAVKNPLNGRLIQADLQAFDGYAARTKSDAAVPCPYISTLYRTATCIGVDDEYSGRCHIESADIASNGLDNNDGISIIDVTNPGSPRYCMVSICGLDATREPKGMYQPLSAKEYVECYYPYINPETKSEQDTHDNDEKRTAAIRTAYEGLLSTPLIDMATLAETWPGEYGKSGQQDRLKDGDYAFDKDSDLVDGAKAIEGSGDEEKKEKMPSLATMAIFRALQTILQDEDNADQIDFLLRVPMGQESIDAVIKFLAAGSQLPDYILPVLAKVLGPSFIDGYVDLSPFALSGSQISQVAKLIPTCKILKLGGRMNAEIEDIVNAIKCLPELDTVMLFDGLVSVEQLSPLRQELPSDRIRIAHREEYFEYAGTNGPQYRPRNVPEFVFVNSTNTWRDNYITQTRGVGVEVLNDPNLIIQTIRDFLHVECRFEAATIGFATNKREYGVPFASSAFVSIASSEAKMEGNPEKVQWGFVCNPNDNPQALKYGFFRYQHGSPLQVMDVDGFVTALSKERPDLPPVVSGSAQPGVQFTSFLEEVRYLLGAKSGGQTEKDTHSSKLLPVKRTEEILFVDLVMWRMQAGIVSGWQDQ